MIQIKFKNLEKSELAREAARDRIEVLVDKFPDLKICKMQVTIEMENSPSQAGLDRFKVKLHIAKGRYSGIIVEKANSNFYVALAEVVDHMLEALNRSGDRVRVKERRKARQIDREVAQSFRSSEQKIG